MAKFAWAGLLVILTLVMAPTFAASCGPKQTADRSGTTPESNPPSANPPASGTTGAPGKTRETAVGLNIPVVVHVDDDELGKHTVEITLVEIISDDKAWGIVKAGNQFNDAPGTGEEYILAKFRVRVLESSTGKPYDLNHAKFMTWNGAEVTMDHNVSVSGVKPSLRQEVAKGAEHTGYTHFLAKKSETPLLTVFEYIDGDQGWFKLRP